MAAKIKKGDRVVVLTGKDKGRTGNVLKVLPSENRVVVEGVNMVQRHTRPSQADPQGGIKNKEASLHLSNVAIADANGKATLANARSLTDRWAAVGSDVRKLTDDPKFMDGIRNVSVGLGKFFDELYPAQMEAARDRAARKQGHPDHPPAAAGPSARPAAP